MGVAWVRARGVHEPRGRAWAGELERGAGAPVVGDDEASAGLGSGTVAARSRPWGGGKGRVAGEAHVRCCGSVIFTYLYTFGRQQFVL